MEDKTLENIKTMLEGVIGTDVEQAVLDGLQEYLNGRKQDMEAAKQV
jgi:hypothetical protein